MSRHTEPAKGWPPRLPAALEPPAVSLWDSLAVSAARYPDKPAVVFLGRRISYAELLASAERLAAYLAALDVKPGDRVLVAMQNCPQLIIAHYAIARVNAVAVPVNPMNHADELRHYIADSGARVAIALGALAQEMALASNGLAAELQLHHLIWSNFCDVIDPLADGADVAPQWRDWLQAVVTPTPLAAGNLHAWLDAMTSRAALPDLIVGRNDLALLPYTSGTTGLPKGCMLTHGNVTHNAMGTAFWITATPGMVTLAVLPLFHITGLVCVMHSTIFAGGTLVVMPRWDRDVAARLVAQNAVSHWISIPTMIVDLLASPDIERYDFSSLAFIGGGGAAMPQAVAERLRKRTGLEFVEGYGLTETSAVTVFNPCDAPKLQCLGIAFISVDVRIVDIDSHAELPDGETGEIVIHGPQVFKGYWRRDVDTADAFIDIDGKRFFRTGDVGYRDADGYLFLSDRLKRMINASGYKVWPAEIEALLYRHPAIQEACVISARDAYRGETVKAVVVRRAAADHLSADDLIAWCRAHISSYKIPRSIAFVEALPKNASGKIMWRTLQDAEWANVES
jgi:fatty-acyl-CoA synthase